MCGAVFSPFFLTSAYQAFGNQAPGSNIRVVTYNIFIGTLGSLQTTTTVTVNIITSFPFLIYYPVSQYEELATSLSTSLSPQQHIATYYSALHCPLASYVIYTEE